MIRKRPRRKAIVLDDTAVFWVLITGAFLMSAA